MDPGAPEFHRAEFLSLSTAVPLIVLGRSRSHRYARMPAFGRPTSQDSNQSSCPAAGHSGPPGQNATLPNQPKSCIEQPMATSFARSMWGSTMRSDKRTLPPTCVACQSDHCGSFFRSVELCSIVGYASRTSGSPIAHHV